MLKMTVNNQECAMMLTSHRDKGEIFKLDDCPIQGRYSIFGDPRLKDMQRKCLPKGTYYIIDEKQDTKEYLVGEVEYLQGGFYLLGKRNTYFVPSDSLEDIPFIDKVPDKELEEVINFLRVFQNRQ